VLTPLLMLKLGLRKNSIGSIGCLLRNSQTTNATRAAAPITNPATAGPWVQPFRPRAMALVRSAGAKMEVSNESVGEARDGRSDGEHHQATLQRPLAAVLVSQCPGGQKQPGKDDGVGVDDPLGVDARGLDPLSGCRVAIPSCRRTLSGHMHSGFGPTSDRSLGPGRLR